MSRRIIFIILIFLLTAIAIAVGFWAFYSANGATNEIIIVKKDAAEIERREANIKMLEELILSIVSEEAKVADAFTDSDNLVLFIENLEAAARGSGVLLEIESAEFADSGGESLPHFRLKTSGSFGGNFRFLRLLEAMPFQLELNDASFSVYSSEPNTRSWQLRTSITLFSFLNK